MIAPFVPTSTPIYRPRCTVYVDGFNFYFGIFENHPEWKWLNIERFFTDLRPLETVSVKYFTAIVDEDIAYSEAKFRQEKYLKALGTLPNLQIIKGKYQKKLVRCQAECAQEYSVPREKKTDVNIAVHMISDCLETTLDSLVLVSDDSDLEPAIAWIHKKYSKLPITVYIPKLPEDFDVRRYDFYRGIGVTCSLLPIKRLSAFQFATAIKIATAKFVQRPEEWAVQP